MCHLTITYGIVLAGRDNEAGQVSLAHLDCLWQSGMFNLPLWCQGFEISRAASTVCGPRLCSRGTVTRNRVCHEESLFVLQLI